MAAQLFVNNFATTLASGINNSVTAMTLASGTGVPAVAGGDWWLLTIEEAGVGVEIVKVTAATAGSASITTMTRNHESSGAKAFTTAAKVEGRLTKGTMDALAPKITPTFKDGSYWGDDSYAQQTYVSPSYPNTLNCGYHQDADGTTLWLNYLGFNNSNTRYRTVSIGNGRSGTIATFTGAAAPTIDFFATFRTYALKVYNNASCMFSPYSGATAINTGYGCYYSGSAWTHANGGVNSAIFQVDTDTQLVKWYAATNSTSGTWNIADGITLWSFAGRWQQGVDLPASAGMSIASGAPGTTTTKLYQVSGALYWDGGKVKMLTDRVQDVTATFTSITPDVSTADIVTVRGASSAITLNNPTGSPTQGQKLIIRIKDNGTARAISYGTEYRNMGATKPTTTVLSKTLYLGLVYNSTDTKWDLVAVAQEA